jgi:hypothetical protein
MRLTLTRLRTKLADWIRAAPAPVATSYVIVRDDGCFVHTGLTQDEYLASVWLARQVEASKTMTIQ